MKIYGSEICSGCRAFKSLMLERGIEAEFIDITENVANLRAFLHLRDTESCFDSIRAEGRIGIPVFVNDDVAVTDSLYTVGRRGVAGTMFVHKIAGAAAEPPRKPVKPALAAYTDAEKPPTGKQSKPAVFSPAGAAAERNRTECAKIFPSFQGQGRHKPVEHL